MCRAGIIAQLPDRLVAIQLRHHQIHQNQIRDTFLSHAHKLRAIGGKRDLIPLPAQHQLEQLPHIWFIVRYQDAFCHIVGDR